MHLDVCLILLNVCWQVWIGFLPMMQFKFCTSYVHAYVFPFFSISLLFGCDCVLSLSRIDCIWHPKRINPLCLRILLVSGLLLLILSLISMFGSVMRRPERTSQRTFRNVAFIRSAMLFCQNFPTLFSPLSFGFGAGNLYLRDP